MKMEMISLMLDTPARPVLDNVVLSVAPLSGILEDHAASKLNREFAVALSKALEAKESFKALLETVRPCRSTNAAMEFAYHLALCICSFSEFIRILLHACRTSWKRRRHSFPYSSVR